MIAIVPASSRRVPGYVHGCYHHEVVVVGVNSQARWNDTITKDHSEYRNTYRQAM